MQSNSDISSSRAFALGHSRPGTLSLSLSESDEDPGVRSRPGFSSLEFLITTGEEEKKPLHYITLAFISHMHMLRASPPCRIKTHTHSRMFDLLYLNLNNDRMLHAGHTRPWAPI